MSDRGAENKTVVARFPSNALEQLAYLPTQEERVKICESLFKGVSSLLESHGVIIDYEHSSFRSKSEERINEKIKRRGYVGQIVDIYGLRMVTEYTNRSIIGDLVHSAYPLTPDFFANGKPTFRDFSDPEESKRFREKFNSSITEKYTATHINIVFPILSNPILAIGEIQIRNLEEANKFEKTYLSVYRKNQEQKS